VVDVDTIIIVSMSFVNALTLLVGRQEGHPACKSSATTTPKVASEKMGQLNKNQVCVYY